MDWIVSGGWIWLLFAAVIVGVVGWGWKPLRRRMRERELVRGLREFRRQREGLEAKFLDAANRLGKPRGLIWADCDWHPDVVFAREVRTGVLTAIVGVSIRFEAIVGGDMEDVEAVGQIRDASAVFQYRRGQWGTSGRALFNMSPADALVRLEGQFVAVEGGRERGAISDDGDSRDRSGAPAS